MIVRELKVVYGKELGEMDDRVIRGPADVIEILRDMVADEAQEVFGALLLNARHKLLSYIEISRGTLTAALVHPREIFKAAILVNAASILLIHNHPSGDPNPSAEDREVTQRIYAAGELLGITLIDHAIFSQGGKYFSFHEQGLWPPPPPKEATPWT